MNMKNTSDKTAIVGIRSTEISRDCGRTELKMATEAILDAVEDAGLNVEDSFGRHSKLHDGYSRAN